MSDWPWLAVTTAFTAVGVPLAPSATVVMVPVPMSTNQEESASPWLT